MRFVADAEGHLGSPSPPPASRGPTRATTVRVAKARAVVTALGGRLEGVHPGDELTILLPQR